MARYAGVQFETVVGEHLFSLDGILVITESITNKKFAIALRARNNPVPVATYQAVALDRIGAEHADKLSYELSARKQGFSLMGTLNRVRAAINESGSGWTNVEVVRKTGVRVNLEETDFYIYGMRHKTINCVYLDYAFFNKKLKDPMGPKSATFNNHVKKGVRHSNSVMHAFTEKNFPLQASDWAYGKILEKVTGVTNAKRTVGQISSDMMRQGIVVLNSVHGIDPVGYRNHRLPLAKISVEGYLNSKPIPRVITSIEELIP